MDRSPVLALQAVLETGPSRSIALPATARVVVPPVRHACSPPAIGAASARAAARPARSSGSASTGRSARHQVHLPAVGQPRRFSSSKVNRLPAKVRPPQQPLRPRVEMHRRRPAAADQRPDVEQFVALQRLDGDPLQDGSCAALTARAARGDALLAARPLVAVVLRDHRAAEIELLPQRVRLAGGGSINWTRITSSRLSRISPISPRVTLSEKPTTCRGANAARRQAGARAAER